MAERNANFQSSALYHGTTHPFNIGDTVEPRNGNPAYATADLDYAITHADRREMHEYDKVARSGRPEDHAKAALITGQVYQVEPLDETEGTGMGDDKGNVMSQKGFKVIKKIK